ncbi:hypothetical protein [Erythrobacter donghaensis]|uniref:hypothetical protein n=1 Tax=Erythrobacter donghaensis TaxID=267135 RepID=UPI0011803F4B|nr:hypothetical protein [Erythrobacter donghaensis]
MKAAVPAIFALLAATAPAAAEEHVPVSAGPEVDGLVAALEAKDRNGAIGRIKGIFALNDEDRMVRTPAAFVDLVIGCPAKQIAALNTTSFKLYTYRWDCAAGEYQAQLGKDPDSSYIEVVDPADAARIAKRAAAPRMKPMLPPPMPALMDRESPEARKARVEKTAAAELAALKALEPQLKAGVLTDAAALAPNANFTTGYRDIVQSAFIAEMDGDGLSGANEQLAWLTANLGKPDNVECRQIRNDSVPGDPFFIHTCRVLSEQMGHGYAAMVFFRDAKIASIQFNYVNAAVVEKIQKSLSSKAGGN